MGIKGLIQWIKKVHPEVVTAYKSRWASPEFKGKRVAIDGTLMTNRFHFAVKEGPLKGKGGAMGWYNMISEMRAQGVQPIAIWDERGVREWKAPEANKRLANRAIQLARRNHEDQRAVRLAELRDVIEKVQLVDDEDKTKLIQAWSTTISRDRSSPTDLVLGPASPSRSQVSGDMAEDDIWPLSESEPELLSAIISSLRKVMKESAESVSQLPTGSLRAKKTKLENDPISALIEQETIFEEYRKQISASADESADDDGRSNSLVEDGVARDIISSPPDEVESLDERLAAIDFFEMYTETPSQKALTTEENQIIKEFLIEQSLETESSSTAVIDHAVPTTATITEIASQNSEADEASVQTQSASNAESPASSSLQSTGFTKTDESLRGTSMDPLTRLEDLIVRAPKVREIHDRALGQPTAQDHMDCRELLEVMGIPVIEAVIPFEAEGMAACMANAGLVDYVVSEDSDVLAYEAPLISNASRSFDPLLLISGSKIRQQLSLTPSQYQDFCILLGTDASPRIPAIGPNRAINLITQHGTIEEILESHPKLKDRVGDEDLFLRNVANARWIFSEIPPVPQGAAMQVGMWDERRVGNFMEERWGIKLVDGSDWDRIQHGVGGDEAGVWFKGWDVTRPAEDFEAEPWMDDWDESPPQSR